MIAKGKSPGDAASTSIDKLDLASCRASIVMIPVSREGEFEQFQDRLLDAETSERLLQKLGIRAVLS